MFDFENLKVYQKAVLINRRLLLLVAENTRMDFFLKDQMKRASLSILLNIAEGNAYFSKAARRNFFIIARGSVFECVALIAVLQQLAVIAEKEHDETYVILEEISRMLFILIQKLA